MLAPLRFRNPFKESALHAAAPLSFAENVPKPSIVPVELTVPAPVIVPPPSVVVFVPIVRVKPLLIVSTLAWPVGVPTYSDPPDPLRLALVLLVIVGWFEVGELLMVMADVVAGAPVGDQLPLVDQVVRLPAVPPTQVFGAASAVPGASARMAVARRTGATSAVLASSDDRLDLFSRGSESFDCAVGVIVEVPVRY